MTRNTRLELQALFDDLAELDQQAVLSFVQFLHARGAPEREKLKASAVPLNIAPAPDETVIGALKRLSESYPMLDKRRLLDETSILMAQHTLQGRPKVEVITELEFIFQRHYAKFSAGGK